MYKTKKRNKVNIKIVIIAVIIITFLGISLSVYMSRSNFLGEGIIKDVFMSINKIVMYPFTALNDEKGVDQSASYLIQKM